MGFSYSDARHFDDKLDAILANQSVIINSLTDMRTSMDPRLQKITDDLAEIKAETGQYIADRDALDVQKDAVIAAQLQQIADLTAQLAAGQITIADFQAGLDAAQASADEAAALLPAVRPPADIEVPPPAEEPPPA